MTMKQYLINKGCDEYIAYVLSSDYRNARTYTNKAIVAYTYGQVAQTLVLNCVKMDRHMCNSFNRLIWKKMATLM